jgi:general secretion pathway protein G
MLTQVKIESMPCASSAAARSEPLFVHGRDGLLGFTLIELMVSICIVGILTAIAVPFYLSYRERARVAVAISDLKAMELAISNYAAEQGAFPESLAQVGLGNLRDPWGFTYRYLRIFDAPKRVMGSTRKDHFMVPVNSDFDLYSVGRDGASLAPFTAKASQDDVVRAFNGAYYGKVAEM